MQFIKNVQNFSVQYNLWKKGSKIVIGVSGGPDSVCLLNVLFFLSNKYDFELQIAHVNYGLRGQDSLEDEKFTKELAKKYAIKVNVLKLNEVPFTGNLENKLRDIRYQYFEKLRKELKFDLIAVAHNQNDQAETVLMKMIRGAGLNGLGAMRPKSSLIIRPLLKSNRIEIIAYLKENQLRYRIDKSNEQTNVVRNKIRHEVLPYLEKKLNLPIIKTLSDLSYPISDDYDFIRESAEKFVVSVCKNKRVNFADSDFMSLHEAIQRQSIRQIFLMLKGQFKDIEYGHIEELRKIIKSGKNKTKVAIVGGLKISKKGANIEILS